VKSLNEAFVYVAKTVFFLFLCVAGVTVFFTSISIYTDR